jgi:hypothetical protein
LGCFPACPRRCRQRTRSWRRSGNTTGRSENARTDQNGWLTAGCGPDYQTQLHVR